MARNIEVKARVRNFAAMGAAAASLSDSPGTVLMQLDTFFSVADGRLKLREARPGGADTDLLARSYVDLLAENAAGK